MIHGTFWYEKKDSNTTKYIQNILDQKKIYFDAIRKREEALNNRDENKNNYHPCDRKLFK